MKPERFLLLSLLLTILTAGAVHAAGRYLVVDYPPSTAPGELQLGVTYKLWIPDGVGTLRGVIVHQHGCGAGACKGGETAACDLHWQALAKKWDCALLGPSYHQADSQECALWCDPRRGSDRAFLKALGEFAVKSGHPELAKVPWCLWGHSGGGVWASLMQTLHPERVVAAWLRSGVFTMMSDNNRVPKPEVPAAAYRVPVMVNPGVKEQNDRFKRVWTGTLAFFKDFRAQGAPIGFAPDPRTSHECGDSRYLAIPFFDACLALRLPEKGAGEPTLKPVDASHAWLAAPLGKKAEPAEKYQGKKEDAVWLPNGAVAKAWMEYEATGSASAKDKTPPPAPVNVRLAAAKPGQPTELTWDAEADFESGLGGFVIVRDGKEVARLPEKPFTRYGRALFQKMSFHDTPEAPLPEMKFVDKSAKPGEKHDYQVIAVNSIGLKSKPAGTILAQ